jgi:hypothetical protein
MADGHLDSLDGCTLPTQLSLLMRDPHEECDRERAAAEEEIARLSLALRLRHEHELHTTGARVELVTSPCSFECAQCGAERPRGVCCLDVSPYRGASLRCCHGCVGALLVERFPVFEPAPFDEDLLPW